MTQYDDLGRRTDLDRPCVWCGQWLEYSGNEWYCQNCESPAVVPNLPQPPKPNHQSLMNESDCPNPDDATVSIIPKSIKIYSDNPIHDAIDRIIDSCNRIDEDDDYMGLASLDLKVAAEDLLILSCRRMANIKVQYPHEIDEQKADKD